MEYVKLGLKFKAAVTKVESVKSHDVTLNCLGLMA